MNEIISFLNSSDFIWSWESHLDSDVIHIENLNISVHVYKNMTLKQFKHELSKEQLNILKTKRSIIITNLQSIENAIENFKPI